MYVRRAYRAYTVMSIDYEEGDSLDDGEPTILTWRFNLGQTHSPPSTPRLTEKYVIIQIPTLNQLIIRIARLAGQVLSVI